MQWEGCSYLQSTFEPEESLAHAQTKLAQYHRKRRLLEIDVATVLCEDPLRTGAVLTLAMIGSLVPMTTMTEKGTDSVD